jgi:hypothetical protein
MLVLSAKHEQLVALPQTSRMAHPDPRYVSIVVYEIPLASDEVQAKDMVVYWASQPQLDNVYS